MRLPGALEHFIAEAYQPRPRDLAIFRLLFAIVALVMIPGRYAWVGQMPDSFFNPPLGFTYFFFSSLPPAWFFSALDAGIVISLVYLLAGRCVTLATLVYTACVIVGNAWAYSFGKIDHDILMALTPLALVAAGWDGRRAVRAWPMALFALIIALAMLTASLQKVLTGWLDPSTAATLGHLIRNRIALEKEIPAVTLLAIDRLPAIGWEFLDYSTVTLEAAFLFALPNRRAFKVICSIACLFHFGIGVVMGLIFAFNLLAYGAFVDWDAVMARLSLRDRVRSLQHWLRRRSHVELLVAAACFAIATITWGNPLDLAIRPLVSGGLPSILVWFAGIGAATSLASQLFERVRPVALTPAARRRLT